MRWPTACLLSCVALAASAKAESTICNAYGTTVVCNTSRPLAEDPAAVLQRQLQEQSERRQEQERLRGQAVVDRFARDMEESKRQSERDSAEFQRQLDAIARENRRQQYRQWLLTIASAVKAGDCERAKGIALDQGRLDIADQAMRLCTPGGPPKSVAAARASRP